MFFYYFFSFLWLGWMPWTFLKTMHIEVLTLFGWAQYLKAPSKAVLEKQMFDLHGITSFLFSSQIVLLVDFKLESIKNLLTAENRRHFLLLLLVCFYFSKQKVKGRCVYK